MSVEDVVDHEPILGFAGDDVDRNSLVYPTTLATNKYIVYDIIEPVFFLNDAYLRDDGQLTNVSVELNTTVSTTDQLEWNETLRQTLGINYTNTSIGLTTSYTFSADIADELDWEMFLMSFYFLQSEMRARSRNPSNRTINIIARDSNSVVTVSVVIDVLPLPPDVQITVQNTTFREGQEFIVLRQDILISVNQDEDAMFTNLRITLQ